MFSIFESFCLKKVRLFCEMMGRILFAVFSFKTQNKFFKQRLIWESSLLHGAAMPGAVM